MKKLNSIFTNEEIIKLFDSDFKINNSNNLTKLIELLEQINCDTNCIRHIIKSNPKYLTNDYLNVLKLIKKLYEIGLTNLNIIFESNPYLLNKYAFEIEEFINNKLAENKSIEEIKDIIDSNPYALDEE